MTTPRNIEMECFREDQIIIATTSIIAKDMIGKFPCYSAISCADGIADRISTFASIPSQSYWNPCSSLVLDPDHKSMEDAMYCGLFTSDLQHSYRIFPERQIQNTYSCQFQRKMHKIDSLIV